MKIRFWGVRGSIPVPGPGTVRYGGNTTCIEIRTDNNELIILDAGTGIEARAVGKVVLHRHIDKVTRHKFCLLITRRRDQGI